MQIVFCDSDPGVQERLLSLLDAWVQDSHPGESISVRQFLSSEDLLMEWESGLRIDTLFIGISFRNEMNGLEAASRIVHDNEHLSVIILSDNLAGALEGYKINALRYLLIPFSPDDFRECLDTAWRLWCIRQDLPSVMIESSHQMIRLPADAIIYVESFGHYLRLVTADLKGSYEIRISMERFLRCLPSDLYARCHKSFLVNLSYVREYRRGMITLSTGDEIPVGRKYARDFLARAWHRRTFPPRSLGMEASDVPP